jgi:pimeloyl-ACP methyl ester carboxylesterase
MKTNHLLIVIMLISALLLASCGSKEVPAPVVPDGAQAGDLIDMEACLYKAGDTEYVAECSTLIVPENRSNPDSRLIALPVIRIRALNGGHAEPIFFLMGGPGKTNLHFKELAGLVDERDFVQVGYRGIDGSSVLDCPETVEAIKAADDMLSETALDNFSASIAKCAERLQSEGVDLAGYTLLERAHDMEAARLALGYEQMDLLSESVGTRTAMIYAWTYPESIHRSVMIAVNPPGHFLWKADVIDEQLEYYSQLCAQDPACSARTDNLAETIREVAHNMPERWLFVPIDPGAVKIGSFFGLFETSAKPLSAPWMFDMWLSAAEGDASGLAMLSLFGEMAWPTAFVWGETAAVSASTDLPSSLEYLAEANLEDTILGTPGSTWMWGGISGWSQADLLPEEYRHVQPSDVETLLIGGTVDFSTPPQFARDELLPSLSKGQQVILQEFGHSTDTWRIQHDATVRLINSFFDTGVADTSLFTTQRVSFDVGPVALPEMLKILLGSAAALLLGLVALIRFVLRRVWRRNASQKQRRAESEQLIGESI